MPLGVSRLGTRPYGGGAVAAPVTPGPPDPPDPPTPGGPTPLPPAVVTAHPNFSAADFLSVQVAPPSRAPYNIPLFANEWQTLPLAVMRLRLERGHALGWGPIPPGSLEIELDGRSIAAHVDPFSPSSPIETNTPIRVLLSTGVTAVPLWTGYVRDLDQRPLLPDDVRVSIRADDILAPLSRHKWNSESISLPQRIDALIANLCNFSGIPITNRRIDASARGAGLFQISEDTPLELMQRLTTTEGPFAALLATASGELAFRNRYWLPRSGVEFDLREDSAQPLAAPSMRYTDYEAGLTARNLFTEFMITDRSMNGFGTRVGTDANAVAQHGSLVRPLAGYYSRRQDMDDDLQAMGRAFRASSRQVKSVTVTPTRLDSDTIALANLDIGSTVRVDIPGRITTSFSHIAHVRQLVWEAVKTSDGRGELTVTLGLTPRDWIRNQPPANW